MFAISSAEMPTCYLTLVAHGYVMAGCACAHDPNAHCASGIVAAHSYTLPILPAYADYAYRDFSRLLLQPGARCFSIIWPPSLRGFPSSTLPDLSHMTRPRMALNALHNTSSLVSLPYGEGTHLRCLFIRRPASIVSALLLLTGI
jgi:hypothetical protein